MIQKKTLVLGASTNVSRYSNMVTKRLKSKGYEVIPVGIKKGDIDGLEIINDKEIHQGIDTITLYLGPANQKEYYAYISDTKPNRVIFNPGTINYPLMESLEKEGVEVVDACTLVMLSTGSY